MKPARTSRGVLNRNRYLGFAAPSVMVMFAIMIFPLGYAVYYSLFAYKLGREPTFVGLGNYVNLLTDRGFIGAVRFSIVFTLVTMIAQVVLGMAIALLMENVGRSRKLLSILIYLPYFISATASGIIFRWIFMSDWGLLSQVLSVFHISSPSWFDDPNWAQLAVVLVEIWQNTPFAVIIFYAGLQAVSSDQMEAAAIDGAGAWRRLWHVTIPNLRHLIILVITIRYMDAFRIYDRIAVMTGGGPGDATESVSLFAYRTAFTNLHLGKGCAAGVLILIMLAIPVSALLKLMRNAEAD
ncbi:MAG: sugar ABC transporter permease [Bifidobacteriaceae bacterium]|nr:sugar ABC transporter permease [Bifidobacteriaceae bacterium]